ncbi:terpene cyclase/mutase family protein [Luteolibacter flavescens]|uniref:Terpene cyclase/mutase family protein n=1 Tax=Luteolibacter flavescens TaxID=1859460 RepID=A0ABT3FTB6_9BACT|nr:prenyltransferase/squalene oxidase repeat-containing protein [Luteolibacter flavescens]MCW1886491.1 terpene cyclase/mutase family protein [Luteolibacter flavescens]
MKARLISLMLCFAGPAVVSAEVADPVFAEWRERVDPAVESALEYLARVQKADGSFPESYGDSTGIPALAGMAFLSKGHLPTEGPYAEALNKSIDFVLRNQREDGLFVKGNAGSGPMYAHNIATLFLSEVSGMVDPERQKKIAAALPPALSLILKAQAVKKDDRHQGGWRYHPGSSDSDTSCSGWALMALRSAKLNGAAVPDQAITDAINYVGRHQHEKEGAFGYMNNSDHARSLTGMGLLCLELCGKHGTPETVKAADYVMKTFRDLPGDQFEFYGNYYNAQGTFQIGGRYWSEYATWMYDTYLKKQTDDGSWNSREAGRVYGTCMMVLAFTVPYRQLPIYQRDETVDEAE